MNALALTFQTIDPSLAESAHQLAAKILTDPMLSDSIRTTKDKRKGLTWVSAQEGPWDFRHFRGASHLANAIRAEEVYAVLRRLKERRDTALKAETELKEAKEELGRAGSEAGKKAAEERLGAAKAALSPEISAEAVELQETAAKILEALVTPPDRAAAVTTQLGKFLKAAVAITDAPVKQQLLSAVQETSATLVIEIDAARTKFDAWFNSAQDRAQQWFQLHTRGLTIGASILIAIALQLDAVEIFSLRHHQCRGAQRARGPGRLGD